MNPENYSPEQRKDIEERVQKAQDVLKELQLNPAVAMQAMNLGNDTFGLKPIPFLQDMKYTSPISPKEV